MFCSKCGNELSDSAKFCNKCGAQVNVDKEVIDEVNKEVIDEVKKKAPEPKLTNNTPPVFTPANNSKPSAGINSYKGGDKNSFLSKYGKVISIAAFVVIAAGFLAVMVLSVLNKQAAKTNSNKAVAASSKVFLASDSALKAMKAMDNTELKKYTYDAQFDKNGVAIACVMKSVQNSNGMVLAKVKITNANKSKPVYVVYTDLSLIDENGKVYPPDNYTFGMDNQLPSITLGGGNNTEGYVMFKVPANQTRFVLRYNYDQVSNSNIYKPVLIEPWNANDSASSTKQAAASTPSTSAPSNNTAASTSAKNQYINGSEVKVIRKTDTIIEVDMKVSIGKSFVGTLYANKFVAKASNLNAVKAYSGLFSDSKDAKTSTVLKDDRIDPTAGDNYYVVLFFNVPKDAGNDFKIYYSYVGDLLPLGN